MKVANDNDRECDPFAMAKWFAAEAERHGPSPYDGWAVVARVADCLMQSFPQMPRDQAEGFALGGVEPGILTGD